MENFPAWQHRDLRHLEQNSSEKKKKTQKYKQTNKPNIYTWTKNYVFVYNWWSERVHSLYHLKNNI